MFLCTAFDLAQSLFSLFAFFLLSFFVVGGCLNVKHTDGPQAEQ